MNTAVLILISAAGVIALVNLVKSFGVTGKWSALAALVIGIALNLAAWKAGAAFAGADWFTVAATGALVGLGASGLYDTTSPTTMSYAAAELDQVSFAESYDEANRPVR